MYLLKRLILIDSYKPGELIELRLDGHTNLNGVNGAGKTTLLRLIPLFFGERPGRLVPRSRVVDTFTKHYLPNQSSYIIFEYKRFEQTCMAIMYARNQSEGLCYRFADKGFSREDFIETRNDGSFYPVSCLDLRSHFTKRRIPHSDQISTCNEYRAIIQNIDHKKGSGTRRIAERYSFCNQSLGHRLKNIEKIVTGMLTRTTDFSDLRDMLANCIEENRDSILLDLRVETLEKWHKEYRAYKITEAERDKIEQLTQLEGDFALLELNVGETLFRLHSLLEQNDRELRNEQNKNSICNQQLERLKECWDYQEQKLKSNLAESKASLEQTNKRLLLLSSEKEAWSKKNISMLSKLVESLPNIKAKLEQEQSALIQLTTDVQDIESQFKQIKAEKEKYFSQQKHNYELEIRDCSDKSASIKEETGILNNQTKESLRDGNSKKQDILQSEQLKLRESRGILVSQIADIQPDQVLVESRDCKQEKHNSIHGVKLNAEKKAKELAAAEKENNRSIDKVVSEKNRLVREKDSVKKELDYFQRQLDANPNTLLGFLRENNPLWINDIAKVINPELLLKEDLEPSLTQEKTNGIYGISLNLDSLAANHAADENRINALLQNGKNRLEELSISIANHDSKLESLKKTGDSIRKQIKDSDLTLGQLQSELNKITGEIESIKQQIEKSKRERKVNLEYDKKNLEDEISLCNKQLQILKQNLQDNLIQLSKELSEQFRQIDADADLEKKSIHQKIEQIDRQQHNELIQLESLRIQKLRDRKVDSFALQKLEENIFQLKAEEKKAEESRHIVQDYQRWLSNEWSCHNDLIIQLNCNHDDIERQQNQYSKEQSENQQQRKKLAKDQSQIHIQIDKLNKDIAVIHKLISSLSSYAQRKSENLFFDNSHTLALLQKDSYQLVEQHKQLQNQLTVLVRHFKKVFSHFSDTLPGNYYIKIENELGFDNDDFAWLSKFQAWYGNPSNDVKTMLSSQAQLFGSIIRNYKEALSVFDRAVDSLSRRLAANIDGNIRFEKIEKIEGRLISRVGSLGYWDQIVQFTKDYDDWNRINDGSLPSEDFANIVKQIAEQLQNKNRIELKLVDLLDLQIMVTENGRTKNASNAEELRQISSQGLSYLILCVFFIALVNMIRQKQSVSIVWPMDELKELHQMNIEMLINILTKNQITLFSAFPDPDPDVLRLFKNRYQVYGFRELIEMDVSEDYLDSLTTLQMESANV